MADILARMTQITADYDDQTALDAIDLDLPEGKVIAFCGPNGSGKSTALRVLRGLHRPSAGAASVAGRPLTDWEPRALAREIAMLSQSPEAPDEMSVADLAMMGRFSHRSRFSAPSAADHATVERALKATGMTTLADRALGHLSGGQLQRAWIAMTLAQDSPRIFLDEPTNHLDIAHALEVLDLVVRLNRSEHRSFVLVLHDLNLAMRYADEVVLFRQGRIAAQGPTEAVMTSETIGSVFEIDCDVVTVASGERFIMSRSRAKP
ncbi:ABC transporter ATP-binding protein [Maritimibacter sp. HL-12]|uniref:ABC transporter ATP-binding protein n=1 Tax=Maritimibacter sp. HL-12 TaxID=1162418 RepID=UPI000A0F3807|nr:ABC transporter ATP-binding protein [Maritimibacter sp. HL-12]SMH38081.1 iron complex transport system ATP-binding protein [Maritimibacter sp. HL-12]